MTNDPVYGLDTKEFRDRMETFWRLEASLDPENREQMIRDFVHKWDWNPLYTDLVLY